MHLASASFDLSTAALFAAVMLLTAFIHGYCAFGFGLISAGLLALVYSDLELSNAVVTAVAFPIIGYLGYQSSRQAPVQWRLFAFLTLGSLVGLPIGYGFLARFGELPAFRAFFGALIAACAVYGLLNPAQGLRLPRWTGPFAGLLSGFLAGAMVSGGPPAVIYLHAQAADPRRMKATLQAFFLFHVIYRLVFVGFSRPEAAGEILTFTAIATLAAFPALLLGHHLARRASIAAYRNAANALLGLIGIALVADALM